MALVSFFMARHGVAFRLASIFISMAGFGGIASDLRPRRRRYRSQQANSYKTSEHNHHRHAKGGRKLAAARWQKEREEEVGATRIERAAPRGSRQRAREREERRRERETTKEDSIPIQRFRVV